ncbi:MAG: hypothetical protein J5490_07155 [Bacteroidales bacterium]|nr:hypothetical protein [Bacteroidales bacterium]
MKTIRYIVSAIVLAAGLIACQREITPDVQLSVPDDDAVMVSFKVQFPEPVPVNTKGHMGEGPTLADGFDLWFCVLGPGDGFVQNWVQADLKTPSTTNGYITGGEFTVMLPISDDKRVLEVIANPPFPIPAEGEDLVPPVGDYFYNVLEKLINEKGTDNESSYWQEIVLERGIRRHLNGNTYVPDDDLVAALENIHLVRNFAKFSVISSGVEDFTIGRWTLVNVPDKAYVAPFDGSHSLTFPLGYTDIVSYTSGDALLAQLTGYDPEGQFNYPNPDYYPGYLPPEATIVENFLGEPDDFPDAYADASASGSLYMYERPIPTSSQVQTAVLMEVTFGDHIVTQNYNQLHYNQSTGTYDEGFPVDEVTFWYKVELLDKEGQYEPFLRNIAYRLDVKEIEEAGELTATDALRGAYFGNISASLETASLNELSNGTSLIHVDQMDYTFMIGSTDGVTKEELLMFGDHAAQFYFIPDQSTGTMYYQDEEGVCEVRTDILPVAGYQAAVTSHVTNADAGGNGAIKVTLAKTGDKVKKSIIRVSGKSIATNKTIYREIVINLMETQSFAHGDDVTAITNTPVISGAGNEVDITIYLPEDLGASIFPVQVRIEAENNSLSATSADLPVATGKSIFDETRNTYYFIKTINYSDYCKLNPRTKKYEYTYAFPMKFYTNKPGDNSTQIYLGDMATPARFNSTTLTLGTVTP